MGKAENAVKDACRKLLELRGWYVINHVVGHFKTLYGARVSIGKRGQFDLIALSSSGCLLVEVKTKDGVDEDSQREFAAEMDRMGIPHVRVRSVEELKQFLLALDAEALRRPCSPPSA